MKCVNCGGTEFEKSVRDGAFTTPYSCEFFVYRRSMCSKTVIVPRYFHACLKCGLVHQVLDLEARREGMKELIDFVLEHKLTEVSSSDDRFTNIERISIAEVHELTNILRPQLDELMDELLQGHEGYESPDYSLDYQGVITPVKQDDEWIYGEKK